MLYPRDIESKLGVDKIRGFLKQRCASFQGQSVADRMKFSSNYDVVQKLLLQTGEFQKILSSGSSPALGEFIDIQDVLVKSETEGVFCTEGELLNVAKSIEAISSWLQMLYRSKEDFPELYALSGTLEVNQDLQKQITDKIDDDETVKDTASTALQDIRISLRSKYNQVKKSLQSIFKSSLKEGYIPEGASLTIRDGRMVFPLLAEYKRRVPGFVHDESSTGGTVYLEPTAVLEGNNEIRELEYAEKREIIRILTSLTDRVRENLLELRKGISFVGKLDFIRAKAKLSTEFDCIIPALINSKHLDWVSAKHPLLVQTLSKENKEVVPLTVKLTQDERILIISGPNAGGKSVSLKTVGLLQYMLQCGMPIPLGEESKVGIFEDILIDIGDEQSLENDLSTYSSHLKSMRFFTSKSTNGSLCLIDEFGTGTDPQFGGAIAQAVLNQLNENHSFGVITTHYSNIKNYAENTPGIFNGAMRFDMRSLEPLFSLEMGKPGSSFSLEIARKTGLNSSIIDYAKELIGEESIDVDKLLMQLEKQKQQIAARDNSLKRREEEVKKLEANYSSLLSQLDSNKKDIIKKAKDEAAKLLQETNKEIEKTIRHIKSNKAQKTETRKARGRLDQLKEKVKEPQRVQALKSKPDKVEISVGDQVLIVGLEVVGTVLSLKGNDVEVQIGLLKSKIKKNRLTKVSRGQAKSLKKVKASTSHGLNLTNKLSEFNTTLDVRGKRAEEVLTELDKFLNDAILFGLNEIKVLHGKGNGVLREVVRNYAKTQSTIISIADEHVERGGAGVSIIRL